MAEGLASHLSKPGYSFYSAGTKPKGIDPRAAIVMEEIGINIFKNSSKDVAELEEINFDFVVTVCGHAHENCPVFPDQSKVIHHGFDDPPALTKELDTEKEILKIYRRVRDEIKEFVSQIPDNLLDNPS